MELKYQCNGHPSFMTDMSLWLYIAKQTKKEGGTVSTLRRNDGAFPLVIACESCVTGK